MTNLGTNLLNEAAATLSPPVGVRRMPAGNDSAGAAGNREWAGVFSTLQATLQPTEPTVAAGAAQVDTPTIAIPLFNPEASLYRPAGALHQSPAEPVGPGRERRRVKAKQQRQN